MHPPQFQEFGRLVWKWLTENSYPTEDWEEMMSMAQTCGLVREVVYDPAKHGEMQDVDPGDICWFWGVET